MNINRLMKLYKYRYLVLEYKIGNKISIFLKFYSISIFNILGNKKNASIFCIVNSLLNLKLTINDNSDTERLVINERNHRDPYERSYYR